MLQKSVPWQLSAIVPAIVIISTIGALVAIVRYKARVLVVLAAYVILLFLATVVSPSGVSDMYVRARTSYIQKHYAIVEGTVSDFHPMTYSGHQRETFSVNGVRFSYSDYEVVPCFNNTASHGGPIREGLRVRIAYSGNCILKLEVADTESK